MKKAMALVIAVFVLAAFSGCSSSNRFYKESEIKDIDILPGKIVLAYVPVGADPYEEDFEPAKIEIEIELYYKQAPITVTHFVSLANSGFYNNTYLRGSKLFSFTAVGGGDDFLIISPVVYDIDDEDTEDIDESEKLTHKSLDYSIKGEFKDNGWDLGDENLKHLTGTLSMELETDSNPDSAGAVFRICLDKTESRDGNRAVFGALKGSRDKNFSGVLSSEFINLMNELSAADRFSTNVIDEKYFTVIRSITVDTTGTDLEAFKIGKVKK